MVVITADTEAYLRRTALVLCRVAIDGGRRTRLDDVAETFGIDRANLAANGYVIGRPADADRSLPPAPPRAVSCAGGDRLEQCVDRRCGHSCTGASGGLASCT